MPVKPPSIIAFVMASAGVVLFSAKAIMVKLSYGLAIDPVSLLLLRMAFSLPVYLLIGYFFGKKQESVTLTYKDYIGVLIAGVFGYYLASLFDFQGLQYITASLERLILFTYPTIVILISRFVLKEQITKAQYYGIGFTYLGMLVIFSPQLFTGHQENFWLGAGLVFLSALTYAFYLVSSGKYIPRFGTIRFTSWALSVSAGCIIFHFSIGNYPTITEYSAEVYGLGAAMALFSTVIPSFLISGAIRRIGASNMAIIGSLGPISTIVLAYIFLGEVLTVYQFVGAAIVIAGVIWVNRK